MTQLPQQQTPGVEAKPQANIYTLLLVVAILALGATIGVVVWNLTTAYGLDFSDIFRSLPKSLTGS